MIGAHQHLRHAGRVHLHRQRVVGRALAADEAGLGAQPAPGGHEVHPREGRRQRLAGQVRDPRGKLAQLADGVVLARAGQRDQVLAQQRLNLRLQILQPPVDGRQLRLRGGKVETMDGPFAETREHLGGYYILEVPDLDAALAWAARSPAASAASVEVRPVLPPMT